MVVGHVSPVTPSHLSLPDRESPQLDIIKPTRDEDGLSFYEPLRVELFHKLWAASTLVTPRGLNCTVRMTLFTDFFMETTIT